MATAKDQLDRLTLTSRAFHHDQLAPFAKGLATLIGKNMVLPMNTGAEAVESAIKVARKWGYEVKGVPDGRALIIVATGNFHGRTTTIISFSDDPVAHDHYGPYTPGFLMVPYGDLEALRKRSPMMLSPSCWSRSRVSRGPDPASRISGRGARDHQ